MHDVAIVGAGPAGIAASIYLKRAGFNVHLFEKNQVGGLLFNAYRVENYPGFPDGIKGDELCTLFKMQLEKWDIAPIFSKVIQITREKNKFILKTTKDKRVALPLPLYKRLMEEKERSGFSATTIVLLALDSYLSKKEKERK